MSEATTIDERIASFDPEDPEALAVLEGVFMAEEEEPTPEAEGKAEGEEDPEKPGEGEQEGESAEEGDAKQDDKAEKAEGEPSAAQEQKVVQAKDGVHTIPYSVLERERDRAARAEATVKALSQQIDELKQGNDANAEENAAQITDEDLEELESLDPKLGQVIRHQMETIRKLSGEVVQLRTEQEVTQQTKEQEVQDEINAAIAGNDYLKVWQEAAFREEDPDPAMWNRAAEVDAMLRKDPYWADKSYAERFAKVAETVRGMYGVKEDTPAPKDGESSEKEQADLKAAADAKLKEKGGDVPTSLSDIPGGSAPAQSDLETLENVSPVALGQKLMDMSPEQLEAYLARFT